MFLIEDLIKVSVMALNDIERGGDRPIKEPERSISEVLKHSLDLLTLGETEFLIKSPKYSISRKPRISSRLENT